MVRLSIIIPSVNDPALGKTLHEVLEKSRTNPEIIVMADAVDVEVPPGVRVVKNETRLGLRGNVNKGMSLAFGEWLVKLDDHCMLSYAWDKVLLDSARKDWIVVPRRYQLDPVNWCLYEKDPDPIDYERLETNNPDKIGGVTWRSRRKERSHIPLDETMVIQGSFYLLHREHWQRIGPLDEANYGPFTQEGVEIALKTWLGGGKVMVNKEAWYAHKHRSFGRVVSPRGADVKRGNAYSRDYWLNDRWAERKHDLAWLMQRFGLSCP
jgi:glycosyltransferase involved in cell wall biosynthesis